MRLLKKKKLEKRHDQLCKDCQTLADIIGLLGINITSPYLRGQVKGLLASMDTLWVDVEWPDEK